MTTMEPKDAEGRLVLLLEEYRTLRAESLSRSAHRMSLLGFAGASAALVVGESNPSNAQWIVGSMLILAAGLYWWRSQYLLNLLSTRLTVVETELNELATHAYPSAPHGMGLRWESQLTDRRGRP